jgi:hypothetical protein
MGCGWNANREGNGESNGESNWVLALRSYIRDWVVDCRGPVIGRDERSMGVLQ